ncbi:calcium-activated potassium channel subunit beta-4-like isoform X2 [Silurus meridionalis]|uniref:calcium-activated potassium channel subunit beta-4-like isoform X2 n=1 Tax=Silurus meridionalis TaxID=175797 RepID=UPI001EEAE9FD|nr:calcium-activated potassium channel subunit beta-4-like isoform X2 [Silurus meridionalis]
MAKIRVSYEYSEAEDRSIRLGLFLIACGVLSLFILCLCWLNPALQSLRSRPANCTVLSVRRLDERFECVFTCGADCRGTSLYPCLQIFVNNSASGATALLHYDEQQLLLNPKVSQPGPPPDPASALSCTSCSYVPKCERDNQKMREDILRLQHYWSEEGSNQSFTCFFNPQRSDQTGSLEEESGHASLPECQMMCYGSVPMMSVFFFTACCGRC